MRFKGSSRDPTASITPNTAAPPLMSYFMSPMLAAGFMEIPPESKVTALPTRTIGASSPPLRCSNIINRGSFVADRPTAASPYRPSASIPARSRTVTSMPYCSAISQAFSARYSGVAEFEGSLARSLARRAAVASFTPVPAPISTSSMALSSETRVKVSSWRVSSLVL